MSAFIGLTLAARAVAFQQKLHRAPLTNIAIYWFTGTITSSMRLYYEQRRRQAPFGRDERIAAPSGVALTTEPVDRAPPEWAERSYNIQHWTEFDRGGHFMAMEEPQLLAEDIRSFFRKFR